MRVAQGTAVKLIARGRSGQAAGGNFIGGFIGIEGQGPQEFAVGHHLALSPGAQGELTALAPQMRVHSIQGAPKGRGTGLERGGSQWLVQGLALRTRI